MMAESTRIYVVFSLGSAFNGTNILEVNESGRTMNHRKANFHLDPEFEAEFFAAAVLDPNDPETQKGAFVSRLGIKAVGAAMMDNRISPDVAYEIAQLPTDQQQARLEAHLIRDAGKFKAE